ncbi:hypothetical protein PR048_031745 [Dryococelus australis]|uniref:Uncharacterized protein n=1 Tax=Dryococelus australis TaxID=614101 RepID=A0ABQ9G661_9NEOP|nr:hypothetical protein PR048_031745 [Dryococelus australis]
MRGWGTLEIPEKPHRPAASSGMIPACKNTRETAPGIESGSLRREASNLIRTVQRHDGNTADLARRSDEALGVRESVARIARSLLDLGRAVTSAGLEARFLWGRPIGARAFVLIKRNRGGRHFGSCDDRTPFSLRA